MPSNIIIELYEKLRQACLSGKAFSTTLLRRARGILAVGGMAAFIGSFEELSKLPAENFFPKPVSMRESVPPDLIHILTDIVLGTVAGARTP